MKVLVEHVLVDLTFFRVFALSEVETSTAPPPTFKQSDWSPWSPEKECRASGPVLSPSSSIWSGEHSRDFAGVKHRQLGPSGWDRATGVPLSHETVFPCL